MPRFDDPERRTKEPAEPKVTPPVGEPAKPASAPTAPETKATEETPANA